MLKYLYPLCFCKILKVQFCILCACQPESDIFLPVVHQIRKQNYCNRRALLIAIFNSMEAWFFLAYFLEMNFIFKMIRSNNIFVGVCTIVMPGIGCFFKRVV